MKMLTGVSRDERRRWAEPTTLTGLGQMTALWFEGQLKSRPGQAHGGPGHDVGPEMRAALAAANRAGYVTRAEQPGLHRTDLRGIFTAQHAAVEGFTDEATAGKITAAASGAGLLTVTGRARRWLCDNRDLQQVSFREGVPVEAFGAILPRRRIRDPWTGYGLCSRQAQDALCGAVQVAVIAPVAGERVDEYTADQAADGDALWSMLRKLFGQD